MRSIPGVADVSILRGAAAAGDAAPDLLLEVAHGATRAAHFDALFAAMRGSYPDDLRAFFFVNTDVGAPEVAARVAERVVAAASERTAAVIRCLVPRTLVDCNRVIDVDTPPSASKPGQMTPGIASYVRDPDDLALLRARYGAYRKLVTDAVDAVCGDGGRAVFVHTYAPKSVDVPVDEKIVQSLRRAYEPAEYAKWPWRAEVDLITTPPGGSSLVDDALAARAEAGFRAEGLRVARDEAYPLHPSSMGWLHASRHPGRTLCLELRRDLLVREFTPFDEMDVDPAKADRLAAVLANALTA